MRYGCWRRDDNTENGERKGSRQKGPVALSLKGGNHCSNEGKSGYKPGPKTVGTKALASANIPMANKATKGDVMATAARSLRVWGAKAGNMRSL